MNLVAKRDDITPMVNCNKLHDNHQLVYHAGHSTETALLKVHHDIAKTLNNRGMAALVLLDLSAAFDVIDPGMLRNILNILLEQLVLSCNLTYLSDTTISS